MYALWSVLYVFDRAIYGPCSCLVCQLATSFAITFAVKNDIYNDSYSRITLGGQSLYSRINLGVIARADYRAYENEFVTDCAINPRSNFGMISNDSNPQSHALYRIGRETPRNNYCHLLNPCECIIHLSWHKCCPYIRPYSRTKRVPVIPLHSMSLRRRSQTCARKRTWKQYARKRRRVWSCYPRLSLGGGGARFDVSCLCRLHRTTSTMRFAQLTCLSWVSTATLRYLSTVAFCIYNYIIRHVYVCSSS